MPTITDVNALIELQDAIQKVTESDMLWADTSDRTPVDDKETPACTVESDTARRLYTVGARMRALSALEDARAYVEQDVERRREQRIQAVRLRQISEVALALFWCQVRDEYDIWLSDRKPEWSAIGLRPGWLVVLIPHAASPFTGAFGARQ